MSSGLIFDLDVFHLNTHPQESKANENRLLQVICLILYSSRLDTGHGLSLSDLAVSGHDSWSVIHQYTVPSLDSMRTFVSVIEISMSFKLDIL